MPGRRDARPRRTERALRGLDGVIFSAGYYPRGSPLAGGSGCSALGQTNPFYAACLQAVVPRILYVGLRYAMPRHPQGLPGHEGLFYDSRRAARVPTCQQMGARRGPGQARNGRRW